MPNWHVSLLHSMRNASGPMHRSTWCDVIYRVGSPTIMKALSIRHDMPALRLGALQDHSQEHIRELHEVAERLLGYLHVLRQVDPDTFQHVVTFLKLRLSDFSLPEPERSETPSWEHEMRASATALLTLSHILADEVPDTLDALRLTIQTESARLHGLLATVFATPESTSDSMP